ncbi:SPOR domain-containing protein [Luteimonas aquatica]|uniref:SPOR domain-containing protein n=1 Tax=Luteimonas aquatica TaxID=450364 RepID=UPI001F5915E6|nr:SPOR domain-containing protein [Luteimonas aquatica]
MESQLKQRLIGAAVLVALAVIFLPMLVKGPAPDSGVSDVPLKTPEAPQGDMQTRDLPLVAPADAPANGATGMPAPPASGDALPTVDTTAPGATGQPGPSPDAADLAGPEPMLPPSAAGGDYAVHFGAYASSVSADTVVSRLRGAQLPAYRESTSLNGKTVWRVRVGPYASRADAETVRLRANEVGNQSTSRVVALDAADAATPAATASASKPAPAKPAPEPAKPQPLPPEPSKPVATAKPEPAKPAPAPKPSGAASVGFAVQLGAFSSADQANKKRDELRAAGFSAFVQTVKTDKGSLTRVLAGPVVSRADADRLKAQIKAKTGTDGMVRPHP